MTLSKFALVFSDVRESWFASEENGLQYVKDVAREVSSVGEVRDEEHEPVLIDQAVYASRCLMAANG